MIESSKYNRENYPRKCFWTQERETRVKFNPGLSANRPSNDFPLNGFLRFPFLFIHLHYGAEITNLMGEREPCPVWFFLFDFFLKCEYSH